MKSGIYDSKTDKFITIDQARLRENTTHGWYAEGTDDKHPFARETKAIQKNEHDWGGAYSWSTAVCDIELRRCEAGPFARQLVAGGEHGRAWQHKDKFILSMFKKMGGPSLHLRQIARMHETIKLYRQAERCLREVNASSN
jgi:uptake hydrogenase large subunit